MCTHSSDLPLLPIPGFIQSSYVGAACQQHIDQPYGQWMTADRATLLVPRLERPLCRLAPPWQSAEGSHVLPGSILNVMFACNATQTAARSTAPGRGEERCCGRA
jgi:hypothetical protein